MYGLVNAALKELVISQYSHDVWDKIARAASLTETQFDKMHAYDDALTYQLVGVTCREVGVHPDDFLKALGKFWVPFTERQGYGPLFDIAGPSLHDFLLSLDDLHVRVGKSFRNLRPPSFRFDAVDAHTLRMHYVTQRSNLCPFVVGLLSGLSLRFDTPIQVDEAQCARRGADHCEFVLVLSPPSS